MIKKIKEFFRNSTLTRMSIDAHKHPEIESPEEVLKIEPIKEPTLQEIRFNAICEAILQNQDEIRDIKHSLLTPSSHTFKIKSSTFVVWANGELSYFSTDPSELVFLGSNIDIFFIVRNKYKKIEEAKADSLLQEILDSVSGK